MTTEETVALALLFIVVAANALFALAFRTPASAREAVVRIESRLTSFRLGFLPVLIGIAFIAEGSAVRWNGALAADHPVPTTLQAIGYGLILLGLAVLDLVVWRAPRSEET